MTLPSTACAPDHLPRVDHETDTVTISGCVGWLPISRSCDVWSATILARTPAILWVLFLHHVANPISSFSINYERKLAQFSVFAGSS
jgi:hypothetical protein